MSKFYIISIIGTILTFASGIMFAQGSIHFFLDPASFLLVAFPALLLSLSHYRPEEIIKAYSLAGKNKIGSIQEYKNAMLYFKSARQYIIISAVIAFFMGNVIMLSGLIHVKDPALFGKGFGASLLSVLYASLLILIFVVPFKSALEKKLNEIS